MGNKISKNKLALAAPILVCLSLIGCAPGPDAPPRQLPDPGSIGATLVSAYCTQCHGAPSPAAHTAPEWDAVVRRMQNWRVTKGFTAIADQDREQLLTYLKQNAKK